MKFGAEARPETTAARIVWAAGYHVDQNYFVDQARIEGYEDSVVRNVRFERLGDGYKEAGTWSWETNPFVGSRELDGLEVLFAFLKNWDLKTSNNKVVLRETPGQAQRVYFVGDLGATLGATGSLFTVLKGVTVENARWMGNLLARLSDKQLGDELRAGGFNNSETATHVRTIRNRISQLQNLSG